jgi:uncharacterized membrane protein (UPF0127 family)
MMRLRSATLGLACAGLIGSLVLGLPAMAQDDDTITAAQPVLPTQPLSIQTSDGKTHNFHVEMATTPQQQEVGLMFRTAVRADGGMLFVFPTTQEGQFWMKNTLVPLDMVFINPDGTIRSIAENTVPHSLGIDDSGGPILAVLELQGGLTAKENISVGDKVIAPAFHDTK